ncbi:MAG: tetratricopeptide repeat protein [Spirosomataceae bacterium]
MFWYSQYQRVNLQQTSRFHTHAERLSFLQNLKPTFERCPDLHTKAAFYCILSNSYFVNSDFKNAFTYSLQSRQLFEQIGYQNIPEAAQYLMVFFKHYYYFEDYRQAIHYSLLAEQNNAYSLIRHSFLLNDRGMAYLRMKDYANAANTFLRAIQAAQQEENPTYVGIASGNYGNTLRLQKRYAEALPYLYKDVELNQQKLKGNTSITRLYIAQSLMHFDSLTKAKTFIDAAAKAQANWLWSSFGRMYYETQAIYYQKVGNFKQSLLYKDSLAVLQDSLRKIFDNKILTATEAQHAAEKYLHDLHDIEVRKNHELWQRNILMLCVLIIAVATIYVLNQRRKRERLLKEAEKQQAEIQLCHATEQLAQYVENIQAKNELIEQMSSELERSKQDMRSPTALEAHIQTLQRSVILTDDDWKQFKLLFERVHPQFFQELQTSFPDLNPAEIRLLTLLKLGMPTKAMANMLGVSMNSLRTSRYRLRKKLESYSQLQPDWIQAL